MGFSFSVKDICNSASIMLLSFWNRRNVESFSIMPFNAAYAGSSLGFGTEDQYRTDLTEISTINMWFWIWAKAEESGMKTLRNCTLVQLQHYLLVPFSHPICSVGLTSFCCRSNSLIRMSRASARAALFAASLASACTREERSFILITVASNNLSSVCLNGHAILKRSHYSAYVLCELFR